MHGVIHGKTVELLLATVAVSSLAGFVPLAFALVAIAAMTAIGLRALRTSSKS